MIITIMVMIIIMIIMIVLVMIGGPGALAVLRMVFESSQRGV